MLIHNPALADEVCALNAIYGDGTVTATFSDAHHTTVSLRLGGLKYSFLIRILESYPRSAPQVLGVDDLIQSTVPSVQQNAVFFRACVSCVHLPDNVCLFDAIEEFEPLLTLQEQYDPISPTGPSNEALSAKRSMMLRDLAARAKAKQNWRPDHCEDSMFNVVDCAVCMEPFFRVETANLQCHHSFCRGCLHGLFQLLPPRLSAANGRFRWHFEHV